MSQPTSLTVNRNCPVDREINILLLGQTGIGKSAFINSLANYLIHNTLEEAINNQTKVIIPTSFTFSDPDTFEERVISIGDATAVNSQSTNPRCRSYIFPTHGRNLRLIDTPGLGDPKGSNEDKKHLFEILSYTSHYEHLNGICLFLKPNEERLTIAFRLFLKQILHYLHPSACTNIIFVFVHARSTFYTIGNSKNLLQIVIDDVRQTDGVQIPFSKQNIFLLDNEAFEYIAMKKHDLSVPSEQVQAYEKSWDHTAREYARLLNYILTLPLHATANASSRSASEQLIRKLSRPLAGTLRLIQQNIQLAKEYKRRLANKQPAEFTGFPQHVVQMETMKRPRLVCTSEKCMEFRQDSGEPKITYEQECYKGYHAGSMAQETIDGTKLARCEVFDQQTGMCSRCGCPAAKHMCITYKCPTVIEMVRRPPENQGHGVLSKTIDNHIDALRAEQTRIESVYEALAKFLHVHAMDRFHDDMLNYLRLFVHEEQMKNAAGVASSDVLDGLNEIISKYEEAISVFKRALANDRHSTATAEVPDLEKTGHLVGDLYRLPIHGAQLRREVAYLQIVENTAVQRWEIPVELPEKAAASVLMDAVKTVTSL